jgi:hypothetical protein
MGPSFRILWNQTYFHTPQEHRARAADRAELKDMDEAQAEEETA